MSIKSFSELSENKNCDTVINQAADAIYLELAKRKLTISQAYQALDAVSSGLKYRVHLAPED